MKTVLIVDDSKFARTTTKKLLETLNYKVIGEAVDGLEGVSLYKDLKPDFLVTDLEMPNLSGIDMIKEIKSYNDDAKIIVISTVVNAQITQEAIKLSAIVIKKPIKEQKLVNALKLLSR